MESVVFNLYITTSRSYVHVQYLPINNNDVGNINTGLFEKIRIVYLGMYCTYILIITLFNRKHKR